MPPTYERPASDKLAQIQYEEMLKARVLTQAKAVYSGVQFQGSTFDVIINSYRAPTVEGTKVFVALLISYDNSNPSGVSWRPLLQSKEGFDIEDSYQSLADALYIKSHKCEEHFDERLLEFAENHNG